MLELTPLVPSTIAIFEQPSTSMRYCQHLTTHPQKRRDHEDSPHNSTVSRRLQRCRKSTPNQSLAFVRRALVHQRLSTENQKSTSLHENWNPSDHNRTTQAKQAHAFRLPHNTRKQRSGSMGVPPSLLLPDNALGFSKFGIVDY